MKWMTVLQHLILGVMLMSGISVGARELAIRVSPDGNDSWIGSEGRPLASLTGARNFLRKQTDRKSFDRIRVVIEGGLYRMPQPLILTPEDSGRPDCPIIYEAAPDAKPIFSGGIPVNVQNMGDRFCRGELPKKMRVEQLYVDGMRATRSREPDTGFFKMLGVGQIVHEQGKGRIPKRVSLELKVDPTVMNLLKGLPQETLRKVFLVAFHHWDNTKRFVSSIDTENSTIILKGEGMKPWNPMKRGTRFYLENIPNTLTKANEWFRDSERGIVIRSDARKLSVVAPETTHFIKIEGSPETGRFVGNITFKGLTFMHAAYLTPKEGFNPAQAANPIGASVMVDGGRAITFEDCEISATGNYGIWFRKGCSHCRVQACFLHDLGAGGIRIGETVIRPEKEQQTFANVIDNCIIHDCGNLFPCAVGIWVGHSYENRISHNDVGYLYYSAISAGWQWGYGPSLSTRNEFVYNHLHHIGLGLLSDMGAVYTLGPSEGTVVANNLIHDVQSYAYGGWGLYTDEGSSDIVMENNLVYNTKSGGFHQHYGRNNVIRNNIFAGSTLQQLQVTRAESHRSFSFTNNIVTITKGRLFAGKWDEATIDMDKNCYWAAKGANLDFLGRPLKKWQELGRDKNSIIADPKFKNPESEDFSLTADSPAIALGFKPFDYRKAGVYGESGWIEKAKHLKVDK
ncbi:MAG: right-handed parallel beta-helix repeat-containing protein [Verrucomicrobia bacterium]|nr:right-handed parallel beta-helix repeat-containing protein [Verrucomicrobiota bacterium]